ncbi:MAG: hypothetical protein OHK0057_14570 [Thermoflexibacter sp.]
MSKYIKINQIINQVEQLFPVHTWKVNDLDAWVLIRIQLGWELLEHFNQLEKQGKDKDQFISSIKKQEVFASPSKNHISILGLGKKIVSKLKRWVGLGLYYIRFYQEAFFYKYLAIKQIQSKANYLFFVPSSSVCKINRYWFNQFADPLVAVMTKKEQTDCIVLEANNGIDKKYPKFYKNYYNFEKLIAYHLDQYFVKDKFVHLPQYEDFLLFLSKEYCLTSVKLNIKRIVQCLENIERLSLFFQHLLRKNNTKYVFLICYYWDWAMALVHACYQKGVKTIEIQHGSQENWFPYAQWTNLPLRGYNMLPDYFWCWTEGETKQINNWVKPLSRHVAFEGGHPWLSFFNTQNFIQNAFKEQNERLAKVKKAGKRIILYTVQPLSDRFLSDNLINIIKETAENFVWWLRVHPRLLDKMDTFQQEVREVDISSLVEITDASILPLPLLLQHTDLHITQESSSVIEAYLCNVPSIILSEDGSVFYEFVQEQKYTFYYSNLQSNNIKETINRFSNFKRDDLYTRTLEETIQNIIQNNIEQLLCQ